MWTIIELISKNPEISLSSRNNPEMSQRSSGGWVVRAAGWYHLKY